jgi:NAD(P)-dependent dehydrogenase (short-subunit alcohol dehydrogenase family)/phosphopantetheinyl transferase (holo-ACP synthase)/acyl carrier protein
VDHEPAAHRGEVSEDVLGDVRGKILSLLADKPGYPADMLDTGLDLEADLGIDTVKQAEFISEVRDAFGIPRIEGLKIADFPTIDHIIGFVRERTVQPAAEDHEQAAPRGEASEGRSSEVRGQILSLLADKTGYPADMLDTDLDLEADLGIDTVKQAEFISEVREIFGIPRIEGLKIADFPTINHIIEFVFEKSAQVGPDAVSEEEETERTASMPAREEEIRLFEARRTALHDPGKISTVETDRCLIFGGPDDLAEEVKTLMSAGPYGTVERLGDATSPADLKDGERIGIVNLFPAEPTDSALRSVFDLYLSLARGIEQGPAFLVTVLREDGAFGFERPAKEAHIAGAAAGATKAYAREYPETRVRLLDIHPESDRSDAARTILRSLGEEFPLETGVAADGTLTAVRLVPAPGEVGDAGIREEDVILVSGGGRGITTECLKRLAEGRSLTLTIMGRTVLSGRAEKLAEFGPREWEGEKDKVIERMKREGTGLTPVKVERELSRLKAEAEVFRTLSDLRSLGAEVIYRPLDIRDADRVDAVIEEVGELCGRVDLVLHAAGIDVSRSLASKTIEEIENVYDVKVGGMINILTALDRHGLQPRRVVGFGSVSGRFGNVAQVDYSAANDGLSHLLRRVASESDTTACTIDWAPWSEIGMATRGSVQQSLEAAGIDFVPPKTGAALLEEVLARPMGESCEVLVAGRFGPFAADAFEVPGANTGREETFAGQKGRIEALVPGEYVRASVTLDPNHVILNDHRINGAAVLPGVGGMEIMRTAATILDPEAASACFEDLRFHSPMKIFGAKPFEAEVEAVRVDHGSPERIEYRARLFSWFADKQGRKVGAPRLHHECRIVVRGEETEITYKGFDDWDSSVWIPEDDIYEAFFHGPGFRFLDHVLIAAKGEAIRFRRMETEACSDMFTDSTPAAVETVFQAGAALGTESRGIVVLPTGIRSVRVLDPNADPAFGELVITSERSWDAAEGRRILGFDGILRDTEGKPVLLLHGIEMAELGPAVLFSHRVFRERVRVEEIANAVETDRDRFIAGTLTPGEAEEFAEKAVPKRAKEWIAGRVALKRSVMRMLAASGPEKYEENGIEIVQDDQGKPAAVIPGEGERGVGKLSLSHSDGLAVAAASRGDSIEGIGVDIEVVEPRSDAWVEDYFTEEEIRAAGTGDERWKELTKIWCLKEAALKAVGTGLRFDLREIDASRVDPLGRATLEFRDNIARFLDDSGHGSFEARVEVSDGTVSAIVLTRRPAGNGDPTAGR